MILFVCPSPVVAADDDESVGGAKCLECHAEVQKSRVGSQHGQIDCEACHGPLARHAADPGTVRPEEITAETCFMCHEAGIGMPEDFPQVDPETHPKGKPCTACHPPHHPEDGEKKPRR